MNLLPPVREGGGGERQYSINRKPKPKIERNEHQTDMYGERPVIFGGVPDVLFLILSMGDASTIPVLCLLNKATYETIKSHEAFLCTSYLRLHDFNPPLDKILTMDPYTGHRAPLSFVNLQKFVFRRQTALMLASRVARSGWGAWWAIKGGAGEMDAEAEMFRQRVERGLYVMFHMSDIARDVERIKLRPHRVACSIYRVLLLNWLPCVRFEATGNSRNWWFPRHMSHIYVVLLRMTQQQREIGKQRWRFRQMLDLERRVDFHIALQMLRQFLETIIFAHCPDDDASISSLGSEDVDITNWFLLRQGAHSLEEIFLELPDRDCCSIEDRARKQQDGVPPVCDYSEALKEYWDARNGDETVDCKQCEAWLRSSSTQSILNDFFGLHALDLGKEWVRQMRGEGELFEG